MSVVAWDGRTIACDRQATISDMAMELQKSKRLPSGEVLAWTGDLDRCAVLVRWYESGADIEKLPSFQRTDDFCQLIVANQSGVRCYGLEGVAVPINSFMAWGSGRAYAMGALAAGATAEKAVEIANRYNIYCGFGVDKFEVMMH